MSDPRAFFDTGFGREADGSVMNLIAAARDVWTSALSVLSGIAEQTAASVIQSGEEPMADPITTFFDTSASFARLLSEIVARRTEFAAGDEAGRASCSNDYGRGERSSLLVQMWITCVTSTLRYWRGLAEVYTKYQPALTRSPAREMPQASMPGAEDRLLADDLRACLREIGDVAVQEARYLQAELERIGEAVARGFNQPDAPKFYQRRWKAKD